VRRRLVTVLIGVASGGAATVAFRFRGMLARRGRIDVYFDDGSFVTFVAGSPEAERLLPIARQVLAAGRRSA
jgi:hypothetical protein